MQPNTYEDWLTISSERQDDARALLSERKQSTGPVYMAGYAVEASLKALLKRINEPFPSAGGEGHNLRKLWRKAGFKLSDINDESGNKTFFIDSWDTSLRYESSLEQITDKKNDAEQLVNAAGELAGWIKIQIRRMRRRRGKR